MVNTYITATFDIETTVTRIVHAPNFLPIPKESGNPIHLDITPEELPETLNIRALPGSGIIYTESNFNACPLSELIIDVEGNSNFENVTELLFEFVATSGVSRIGELKLFGKPELNLDTQVDTIDDLTGTVVDLNAQGLSLLNNLANPGQTTGTEIRQGTFLNVPYLNVAGQLENIDIANIQSTEGFYLGFLSEINMAYNPNGSNINRRIFFLIQNNTSTTSTFRIDLDTDGSYLRIQTDNVNHLNVGNNINTLGDFIPKPLPINRWHFYEFNYDRLNNIMYIYVDGVLHDVWNNTVPEITDPVERLRFNVLSNGCYRKVARIVGINRFASNEDRKAVLKTIDNTDGFPIVRPRNSLELNSSIVLNSGLDKTSYSTTSLVAKANTLLTTTELETLEFIINRYNQLLNKNLSDYYDSSLGIELPCSNRLILWLSADRGNLFSGFNNDIAQWVDYSPVKNHCIGNPFEDGDNYARPEVRIDSNGYKNLSFSEGSYLIGNKLISSDRGKRTIFIVSKRNVINSGSNDLLTIGTNLDGTLDYETVLQLREEDLGNGDIRVLRNAKSANVVTADITENFNYLLNRHVSCWKIDNKTLEFFVDGVQRSITSLSAPLIGDSLNGYYVGTVSDSSFISSLYDILIFADSLDNSEINTISQALLNKAPTETPEIASSRLVPDIPGNGWIAATNTTASQNVVANIAASGFQDVNEYLKNSTENFTLEFWFFCPLQFTLAGSVADMVGVPNGNSANDALRIFMSSGNVGIRVRASSNQTQDLYTGAIVTEGWHHFVWTRNGLEMTLYLDGVQRNQATFSSVFINLFDGSGQFALFKRPQTNNFSSFFWNGRIADLRKWDDRVLTASEVSSLYNANLSYQNEMQWYLRLNPTTQYDSLGPANWVATGTQLGTSFQTPDAANRLDYIPSELGGLTYGYFTETTTAVNTVCDLSRLNNTVKNFIDTNTTRNPRSNGTILQKSTSTLSTLDFLVTFDEGNVVIENIEYVNGGTNGGSSQVTLFEIYSDSGFTNLLHSFVPGGTLTLSNEDVSGVAALQTARTEYYIRLSSGGGTDFVALLHLNFFGVTD